MANMTRAFVARGSRTGKPPTVKAAGARAKGQRRVRYAVIGLGHIAQAAVLPAFAHARFTSELVAVISGDPKKRAMAKKRYGVEALYDYAEVRRCLEVEGIDALYVATPNSEHLRAVEEAAALGVHVLCEKPLGVNADECEAMIRACDNAGVYLMTAYRLHFEAANLKALEAVRSGKIGEPRVFTSVFSYQLKDRQNIRLRADLGGGPLHDIGIYCINAARTLFRDEPIEVHAWSPYDGDTRFKDVDQTVSAHMLFPGARVATFLCSFGTATAGWYQVLGTKGDIRLDPAYEYAQGLTMHVTVNEKTRTKRFPKRDQFAAQLDYFSRCILEERRPEPDGQEGLADVKVIRALQESIRRNAPVRLNTSDDVRHPSPDQRIDHPPVQGKPPLVHARPASE
jgi:predicted dehydrogenase